MKPHVTVRLLALAASVLVSLAARAGEQMLYWMIDGANDIEFEYAVVYAAATDSLADRSWTTEEGYGDVGAIALPKDVEGGMGYESLEGSHTTTLDILTELGLENLSSYSFYIELLQWDTETGTEVRKGVSETVSYGDLLSNNHILAPDLAIPSNLVVWKPATYAPEPTGGCLVLWGLSLLALRRRRGGVR